MTIKELKNMLEEYDDSMSVVFQPYNSMYGEDICEVRENKGIAAFYGNDYRALILTSNGQCGSVCNENDLDLE